MICSNCGQERPHKAHGLCGACYAKARRTDNPEVYRERDRQRWTARREAQNPQRKDRYEANKEHHLAQARIWREGHMDQLKAQQAEYREANRQAIQERNRDYQRNRRDKEKERNRLAAYRLAHPEKGHERSKRWYHANKERRAAKANAWRQSHRATSREIQRISMQRRQARKRALPATLTREQWQAIKSAYKNCCAYCGKESQRLTQDHVIPVSKGGGYTAQNIVPACRSCNSSKGNREPMKPVQPLLL